jgi:putative ABC transport system permease protein
MDFIRYIALAFVIAVPVAWYVMHRWLERFAYRTSLDWWIFALAGLSVLLISVVSVSLQSWRAATANPVDAMFLSTKR